MIIKKIISLSSPIFGLTGKEDTIDVSVDGDVLVTRRTAAKILNGTENWTVSTNTAKQTWRFTLEGIEPTPVLTGNNDFVQPYLCSHYMFKASNDTWNGETGASFAANEANLQICDTNYDNVEAWKDYLAAQYAAGTPVTIVYELAQATEETLASIEPIVAQQGQINIATDANKITATIQGSGWDTIADQSELIGKIDSLTAQDVGARPDTWMPTAADVGARPDTWMPTAENVGALPSDGTADNSNKLSGKTLSEIMLTIYPVGSIYLSTVSANPGTLFGGSWEAINNVFLLAAGPKYAAGSIGGEENVTLTTDQMPAHSHDFIRSGTSTPTGKMTLGINGQYGGGNYGGFTETIKALESAVVNIENTGGGLHHNNMPPYLAVYTWKRVA